MLVSIGATDGCLILIPTFRVIVLPTLTLGISDVPRHRRAGVRILLIAESGRGTHPLVHHPARSLVSRHIVAARAQNHQWHAHGSTPMVSSTCPALHSILWIPGSLCSLGSTNHRLNHESFCHILFGICYAKQSPFVKCYFYRELRAFPHLSPEHRVKPLSEQWVLITTPPCFIHDFSRSLPSTPRSSQRRPSCEFQFNHRLNALVLHLNQSTPRLQQ